MSAAAFNALLRGLLARGALDEARRIVREEMARLGVQPNEVSLNLLMDTAARSGPAHSEEAWDVLEDMQRRGMRADKYTVSILTKGITERSDKRRAPRGVALVEHFLQAQPEDVDEVLVNSLLDVFCRMGDTPRLEATLSKMHEYGIKGSAVTYGTIVKAYGKAGNIDKVLQAWAEMSQEGLQANAVTYGCMLDACVKCGHLEKALHVFHAMKEKGLHRNTILYATLIKGFAKSKDPSAARNLYKEMVSEGVQCNVVVFNSLIDACVRASDMHGAAEVLQQMTAAGIRPDLITFSTLIKGYCSNGELPKAMRLAEEMHTRQLECDEIVYNSLLEGCVKAGDLQLGLRLFDDMRQQNVRPSSVTFSILVKLLSRAGRLELACHLVGTEMRELHNVPPTRMVWSCLVTCCIKARDLPRAVMVLDQLDREGGAFGSARVSMYATVVEGCLSQGEIATALTLCERVHARTPLEEGARGMLSADLLRRVFESVGTRVPEAEARNILNSISVRLNDKLRSSLEDALVKGVRRNGRERDTRHAFSAPSSLPSDTSGTVQGASLQAGMGLLSSTIPPQQQPLPQPPQWGAPYMPNAYPGPGASPGMQSSGGISMPWDTNVAAALASAATAQWGHGGWMPQAGGYPPYGYFPENPFIPPNMPPWQLPWPPPWETGQWPVPPSQLGQGQSHPGHMENPSTSVAAAQDPSLLAAGAASTTTPTGWTASSFTESSIFGASTSTGTPDPEQRKGVAATPVAASHLKTTERTPATTAGRSSQLRSPPEEEEDDNSPLQMRLFASDAACHSSSGQSQDTSAEHTNGQTPMRLEMPPSAFLEAPPGLS